MKYRLTLSGDTVALFLIQVTIVVGTAAFLRTLATHYNQPGILAELAAGIVLGPSILGKLSPMAFNFLFGGEASRFLEIVALIGLILFMFVAGAEVSWQGAFKRKKLLVGLGGLVAPLAAGMLLASSTPEHLLPTRNVELFPISLAIVLSVSRMGRKSDPRRVGREEWSRLIEEFRVVKRGAGLTNRWAVVSGKEKEGILNESASLRA